MKAESGGLRAESQKQIGSLASLVCICLDWSPQREQGLSVTPLLALRAPILANYDSDSTAASDSSVTFFGRSTKYRQVMLNTMTPAMSGARPPVVAKLS